MVRARLPLLGGLMTETKRSGRSHPLVVAQAVLLAFVLSAGPIAEVALGAGPARSPIEVSSHADAREILRGPLRRLAAGRLSQNEQRTLLRGTMTAGPALRPEVAVTVHFDETVTAPMIAGMASAGARVVNVGSQDVEAYVSPDRLAALAQVAGVRSIRPIMANRPSGYVSPAVALHGSNAWQTAGYTGSGVKVGIIDLGFTGLAALLGTELPVTVQARCYTSIGSFTTDLSGCANGETHGTAVAETVLDMAPGVELYIAVPISHGDLLQATEWMTANGVRIINASFGTMFDGPGDGTSPYSNSVYAVVDQATAAGTFWVNAAGNSGDAGWTGAWTDVNANGRLEFANGDELNSVTLAAGDEIAVAIRWADPWGASSNNYALALYSGSTLVASNDDYQAGAGDPFEILEYTATTAGTYDIAISRISGAATPRMQLLVDGLRIGQSLQHRVASGTLPSPADSSNPGMVTVGAVNFATPGTIESYSSRGPTLDGRIKPDLVAADCAPTTVESQFCGTSESAPIVAGAAAQVLQAYPTLTPSQLADWLRSHALPLGSPAPNSNFGWGRLNLGPVPVAPATGVAFISPPTGAVAGAALTGQPTIKIIDAIGGIIGSGPQGTSPISISLAANPTGATLSCPGGLTRSAQAGVVSFAGCAIDTPGTGYTIQAQVNGLPPVVSVPFDILAPGSALPLTLSLSPTTITYGTSVSLTAHLAPAPTSGSRSLEVQFAIDGLAWKSTGALSTDATGQMLATSKPNASGWYRVFFSGAADLAAATSYPVRVTVRQSIALTASLTPPRTILRGTAVTFTSTVRPQSDPSARMSVAYVIYRRVGTSWVLYKRAYVTADANGRARFSWKFGTAGSWYVRSLARATPYNAASRWSTIARYDVR